MKGFIMIVKVNNFFYATALALVFSNAYCEKASTTVTKKFGDSSFKITVKCSKDLAASSKEKVILSTIEKLVKEIDPTTAAKEYLNYLKSTFEKLKQNQIFSSVKELESLESIEEKAQKFNLIMQELMKDLSKKENVLRQSVYFAALSDEAIMDINSTMGTAMQSFMIELNTISVEAAKQAEQNKLEKAEQTKEKNSSNKINITSEETNQTIQLAFQEKIDGFGDRIFNAIKDALARHYKI